jgi:hypothetical protein
MGSNQSSTVKQTTEILNKSITNIVNKNTVSASAKNTNTNSFEIITGPRSDIQNCSLKLGQKINASQQLKVMAKVSSTNELKTMLKSAVDNATSQNNSATNGFLSTAFNNQKSNTEINNILKNEIENNITNDNLTECNGIIDNINNGRLEINGKWDCGTQGPIVVNQELVSAQVVECFANAAQEAIMQNQNIADAVNKSSQENISKNAGAAELVSAFLGPYAMIIIAIVIALVVAIPLLIWSFKSGDTPSVEATISQFLKKASRRRKF